jgi:hypothetical protein
MLSPLARPVRSLVLRAIAFLVAGYFLLSCGPLNGVTAIALAAPVDSRQPVLVAWQSANGAEDLMLDEAVEDLPVVADARWSAALTDNSALALLWWLVFLVLLVAAGLPWSLLLFRSLDDRGAGLARLIVLLLAAWPVWLLSSLDLIAFRARWTWLALLIVGGAGWLLLLRREIPDRQMVRRLLAGPELAFWSVFALFLLFRWINPDSWHPIWGGEKPMEFAHINAILRSAHMPPYDPWFSGGILNYYYYGEYLVAFTMKLTGIPSEIAFNLAQPAIMGLLASGVWTVTATVAHRLVPLSRRWLAGLVGVVVVVIMGNLVALERLLEVLPERPQPTFIDWTWAGSRAVSGGITEFPYFTGLYADLHRFEAAKNQVMRCSPVLSRRSRCWRFSPSRSARSARRTPGTFPSTPSLRRPRS